MEIFVEIIAEIYVELMMLIVPEEKATSRKYRVIAAVMAIIGMLGTLVLVLWGGVLVFDTGNPRGWIPLAAGIVLSLGQIVLGIVLRCRKEKP